MDWPSYIHSVQLFVPFLILFRAGPWESPQWSILLANRKLIPMYSGLPNSSNKPIR